MKIFNSVSDLQAASLTAGQLTSTKGYTTAGDGGGATYLIKTAVDYAGTPDEYGDHSLANGNIAVLQIEGSVNVKQFGARSGSGFDNVANFHAAMTAYKHVTVPEGVFYMSAPLQIQRVNQRLIGEAGEAGGASGIYPVHLGGNTIQTDSLSDVEIANLIIYVRDSASGADDGVGYYHAGGAWLNLHDCTFYNPDPTGNSGTGVVLDDRNLAGTFVAGSYTHNLRRLNMARGNKFGTGIKATGTSGGINATTISECHIISDNCIDWDFGGGNTIVNNLLQTGTGTLATPAGKGFAGKGAMLSGNYMEKFEYDIFSKSGSSVVVPNHHTDNSSNVIGYETGSTPSKLLVDSNGIRSMSLYENPIAVLANNQVLSTNTACIRVSGNGATRSGCTLDNTIASDGDLLYVKGESWSVQIVEGSTADFGPYSSNDGIIFGAEGSVISIGGVRRPVLKSALFSYNNGKWHLLQATSHRPTDGNFESISVLANGTTIDTEASNVYLTGAGAARSSCVLEAPVIDGQKLTLTANSWTVSIIPSTTAKFNNSATSVTFGIGSGNVQGMTMVGVNGVWYETGRAVF